MVEYFIIFGIYVVAEKKKKLVGQLKNNLTAEQKKLLIELLKEG